MKQKIKITQKILDKPRLLEDYKNQELKHPTALGLRLRIGAGGYVTFLLYTRLPGHKTPSRTAFGLSKRGGKYPFMTLRDAASKAALYMSEIRDGTNPFSDDKNAHQRGPLLREVVEKWIDEQLAGAATDVKRDTPNTWKTWQRDRRNYCYQFIAFIEKLTKETAYLSDFTKENAAKFLYETNSKRMFDVKRSALSSLYEYIENSPHFSSTLDENTILKIKKKFQSEQVHSFYRLTRDEVNYLIHAMRSLMHSKSNNTLYYYALTLCIYNGLRISEAVSLKIKDDGTGNYIDFENDIIHFRTQKNNEHSSTRLLSNTRDVIQRVIKETSQKRDENVFLFPSRAASKHISARKCGELFNELKSHLASEFEWTEKHADSITQKKLRNTFATMQAESKNGFSLEETSIILRHKDPKTTMRYYIDPNAAVLSIDSKGGVKSVNITEID